MTALDFPDSPVIGQTFSTETKGWFWTGTVWKALGSSGGSSSVVVSETAPTPATEGNIWYNSSIGKTFIYYGTSWVGMI